MSGADIVAHMVPIASRLSRPGLWFAGAFAVLTTVVFAGWTDGLDDWWYSTMVDLENGVFVSFARGLHSLGTPQGNAAFVLLGVALLLRGRRFRAAALWSLMVMTVLALSTATKTLFDRTRPLDGLVNESSASYPSGHVMVTAAATGFGLAVVCGMLWPHRSRQFMSLAVVYLFAMAWSRTYLRAHWLTDAVGGALFGVAAVLVIAGFARAFVQREIPPPEGSIATHH